MNDLDKGWERVRKQNRLGRWQFLLWLTRHNSLLTNEEKHSTGAFSQRQENRERRIYDSQIGHVQSL